MAFTATITSGVSGNGMAFNLTTSATYEAAFPMNVVLGPAQAGTLTTRTDANTGVLTMNSSGHGIVMSDRLDVYWDGGQRYGMSVTAVSGTSVSIDLGGGTDLPAADTAITAMVPTVETTSFSGDDAVLLVAGSTCTNAASQVIYTESDDTFITQILIAADEQSSPPWFDQAGFTNPLAGVTVGKCYMSHGDATASVSWRVTALVGYDS